MQLDMGDVPAWAAVLVSIGFSGAALAVSLRSNKHSKEAVTAANRAAEAAERQAIAAEKALPPPPPDVEWQVEHINRQAYVLRNVGIGTAQDVQIREHPAITRIDKTATREVSAGASISFMISASLGKPAPRELWVSWSGHPDEVAVRIPPAF